MARARARASAPWNPQPTTLVTLADGKPPSCECFSQRRPSHSARSPNGQDPRLRKVQEVIQTDLDVSE